MNKYKKHTKEMVGMCGQSLSDPDSDHTIP